MERGPIDPCPVFFCFNLVEASHFDILFDDTKENGLPDLSPRLTLSRNPIHHMVVGSTSSQKENEDEAKESFHVYDTIPF